MDRFSWNKKDVVAYEERIMDLRKEEAILEYKLDLATEKGVKIGEEKDEKQAKIAVAKNSLRAGMSIDVIAEITGLSLDEIAQIKEEIV